MPSQPNVVKAFFMHHDDYQQKRHTRPWQRLLYNAQNKIPGALRML